MPRTARLTTARPTPRPHPGPQIPAAHARQVYLLEPHPGTLCRVLDLYAARGIAVTSVSYAHAAPQTMMLTVTAAAEPERLRVLIAKAGVQLGVIEAAMG